MRIAKLLLFILLILVLQSVVFARLKLFGAAPDLVLVSVIIFAVREKDYQATIFAAAAGFAQDILCAGVFFNTITKVIVSKAASITRENFVGSPYSLVLLFVAVFTPLTLLVEGGVFYFFFQKSIFFWLFLKTIIFESAYNLLLVPVLYPFMEKL